MNPLKKHQANAVPRGNAFGGMQLGLPGTSPTGLFFLTLRSVCQCLYSGCSGFYQNLWEPQAPDAGEAKGVPDAKGTLVQSGKLGQEEKEQ